ncbi:hypothetical protein [Streptomyces albogriseolus]|uniref:hypothetical protein n=1 Tax=Streptomyces albogriseolus TaxID=1887 RepID=UPI0033BBD96D
MADNPAVSAAPVAHGPRPSATAPVAHGPRPSVTAPVDAADDPVTPTAPRANPAPHADPPQARRTPAGGGEGDGALGSRSSADQGPARHADAGAVPAAHRPVPRLVPGATASAETSGTREHSWDVHVPPA